MLTSEFRERIVKVLRRHKGKLPLIIELYDPETRYRVPFYSKQFQVAAGSDLLRELRDLGIEKIEVLRK